MRFMASYEHYLDREIRQATRRLAEISSVINEPIEALI
jgi:hypothetical protein